MKVAVRQTLSSILQLGVGLGLLYLAALAVSQ
jgi:hypothetical protein